MSSSAERSDNRTWWWRPGTAIHQLTLDESATVTIYTDANTTNVASVTAIKREETLSSYGHCIGDNIQMYFSPGSRLQQTAVAVFDNDVCSNLKAKLAVTCESGYSSRSVDAMMTYSADGTCHSDTNETSYKAEINMDNSTSGSGTGSMTILKSAKVVYDENTCSFVLIVADEEKWLSPVVPVCEATDEKFPSLGYWVVECFDDLDALTTEKLKPQFTWWLKPTLKKPTATLMKASMGHVFFE
ncbi:hypothetical protein ON010_g7329 [Phytophthora cinnamomi]|nr:hypothetical protein ON010_g7329 [Phytophthora cinnamomi]